MLLLPTFCCRFLGRSLLLGLLLRVGRLGLLLPSGGLSGALPLRFGASSATAATAAAVFLLFRRFLLHNGGSGLGGGGTQHLRQCGGQPVLRLPGGGGGGFLRPAQLGQLLRRRGHIALGRLPLPLRTTQISQLW